jgi:hypothetical protein
MEENTVGDLNEALINATRAIAERDTDLRRVNAVGAPLEYEATGIGLAEPAREAMRDAARRIRAALDQSAEPHNADQPPVREQRERPTHPDGTPYRYHEIKAEGWGYCDGCRMWSTATPERPHQCPQTHMQGPVATSAGIEASSPQERP